MRRALLCCVLFSVSAPLVARADKLDEWRREAEERARAAKASPPMTAYEKEEAARQELTSTLLKAGGLLAAWAVAFGGLGSWVAGQKARQSGEGLLLGILFGPLGVLVEALLPPLSAEELAIRRMTPEEFETHRRRKAAPLSSDDIDTVDLPAKPKPTPPPVPRRQA